MKGTKKALHEVRLKMLGGRDQIRTGVQGFADLCLATRPRDHILDGKYISKIMLMLA